MEISVISIPFRCIYFFNNQTPTCHRWNASVGTLLLETPQTALLEPWGESKQKHWWIHGRSTFNQNKKNKPHNKCALVYVHTHSHTETRTHTQSYKQGHTRKVTHTRPYTQTHTHTHHAPHNTHHITRTSTHIHVHTHAHTHKHNQQEDGKTEQVKHLSPSRM